MFVYVLQGSDDAVWIGETGDLKGLVARLEAGRGLPKPLRAHQPVRLAAVVGPFWSESGPRHLKTALRGSEPERLRALLAGVPDEVSLLAQFFPDGPLHFWTGDRQKPRDWVPMGPEAGITVMDRELYLQHLAPACELRASLELIRQRLDRRYWRVLLGRLLERRTYEDLARELHVSRERIRQMQARAWRDAQRTLWTLLGLRWKELSSLCQEALEGWGVLSEQALAEEAQRIFFYLLTRGLVSREAWGMVVYSFSRRDVGRLVEDFLRADGPPEGCSEALQRLWLAERRRFHEAREPGPGRRRRSATARVAEAGHLASAPAFTQLERMLSEPGGGAGAENGHRPTPVHPANPSG